MSINARTIEETLQNTLNATVTVLDDSHLHVGHEGAKSGGGHYRVRIQSPLFAGLTPVARHRLVYDAVAHWMNREIHALAIEEASVSSSSTR